MKIECLKKDPTTLTINEIECLPPGSVVENVGLKTFWLKYAGGFLVSLRDGTTITPISCTHFFWRERPDAKCVV